jgi:glutathione peroxidase
MQVVNNKSKLPSLRKKSPRVSFFLMNLLIITTLFLLSLSWPKESQAMTCPPLLSQQFLRLQDEAPQNLCQYSGKVILVVNTASYCGFTSQYDDLEKVFAKYKDQGFVVLGFPTNDFGKQEPGNNKEIAEFCHNTYGVKFPMFAKTTLSGPDANPLFKSLIEKTGTKPRWNFYKYIIDRQGNVVDSFNSMTSPSNKKITSLIEKLLKEKQP